MKNKKKGLFALIAAVMIFSAAAVLFSVNTAASAAGDVKYTINMIDESSPPKSVNGGGIFDENEQEVGSVVYKNFTEPSQFTAEGRYYALRGYTINWTPLKEVNIAGVGTLNTGSHSVMLPEPDPGDEPVAELSTPELTVPSGGTGAAEIEITFIFRAIEYPMYGKARLVENYAISNTAVKDEGTEVGIELKISDSLVYDSGVLVKIGDMVELLAPDAVSDAGENQKFFDYALWNTQGFYEYQKLSQISQITITKEFLDDYLLVADEIVIIGVFAKTYSVKIADFESSDYPGDFIEITIYDHLRSKELKGKAEIENYFGAVAVVGNEYSVEFFEGTYIKIKAKTVNYFEFNKFVISGVDYTDSEYVINYLDGDCQIEVLFDYAVYTLDITGQDSLGRNIAISGNLTYPGTFSLGDTIPIQLTDLEQLKQDYNCYNFYFRVEGAPNALPGTADAESFNLLLNKAFLDSNLNLDMGTTLTLNAVFVNRYAFSVDFKSANADFGSYSVKVGNTDFIGLTEDFPGGLYNYNTKVTVVLKASKYAFANISGAYESEREDDTIELTLNNSDRKISIEYTPLKFNLVDKTKSLEGYSVSNLEGLTIGSYITIIMGTAANYEIKKWIINETDVLKSLPADAEYSNGILTIKITEEWLDNVFQNFEFNNDIGTGIKMSYLMLVAGVPSVVAVLIIIFLILIITNAKRKKFIKAELLDEKMKGYTYNAGNMIQDLRDDTFMKVSKKDVKARMKQQKQEKSKSAKKPQHTVDDNTPYSSFGVYRKEEDKGIYK